MRGWITSAEQLASNLTAYSSKLLLSLLLLVVTVEVLVSPPELASDICLRASCHICFVLPTLETSDNLPPASWSCRNCDNEWSIEWWSCNHSNTFWDLRHPSSTASTARDSRACSKCSLILPRQLSLVPSQLSFNVWLPVPSIHGCNLLPLWAAFPHSSRSTYATAWGNFLHSCSSPTGHPGALEAGFMIMDSLPPFLPHYSSSSLQHVKCTWHLFLLLWRNCWNNVMIQKGVTKSVQGLWFSSRKIILTFNSCSLSNTTRTMQNKSLWHYRCPGIFMQFHV